MKGNTKLLVIVGIIALFLLGWYTLISDSADVASQYNEALKDARDKAKEGLYEDAADGYAKVLEMKDSLEIRGEQADTYKHSGNVRSYVSACESMLEDYPTEKEGYVRLAEYYASVKNYTSLSETLQNANARKIQDETLAHIKDIYQYEYEYTRLGFEEIGMISNGMCAVKRPEDQTWGYTSAKGNTKLSFIYQEANPFNTNGFAAVKDKEGYRFIDKNGRDKSIDHTGKNIEDVTFFTADKVAVKYDGKYHYCDFSFKELFGSFDYAGSFAGGIAAVKDGDNWYFIDESGNRLSDTVYEDIKLDEKGIAFRNGAAIVKSGGEYFLVDNKEKKIGSDTYKDADAFNSDQPAAVFDGSKWGYIDSTGKTVCEYKFSEARSFANGFAAYREGDSWGYLDLKTFQTAIEPAFEDAGDFSTSRSAFVKGNSGWDVIALYLSE